jgi:malate dehydrogenase (oxaloacetate-decarboxylating)
MPATKFSHLLLSTSSSQDCALTGAALLHAPSLNKGTAFTKEEREEFDLTNLLPAKINTLDEQVKRAYEQYQSRQTALEKNTFMTSLKFQNEVLFYRLIQDHLKEMFSIIYTPTEGDAIANYSRLFRRSEGCFLNIANANDIESAICKWAAPEDVDVIVCSDAEQILGKPICSWSLVFIIVTNICLPGIGDQGVGGILISIAKLVLYTLCAGVHPNRTMPVVLDVGTDNFELLNDEMYLGLQQPRVRGERYDAFVDRFVRACRKQFPKAYIHFEDFGLQNARHILDKYNKEIPCFNDDVQGTGCVTLAALYAAVHVTKYKLQDLRVVVFGAGTAGIGIADQIRDAIAVESGKPRNKAMKQIWCVDKHGLLLLGKKEELTTAQHDYAKSASEWHDKDQNSLLDVIKKIKPHVLIGTSTKPKAFTKEIVQEMTKHVDRPIIFPLSNPTRLHEAVPEDLVEWTNGKVLTATGSPFPPVEINGCKREIAECNNSVIFPGIGLGVVLSRARLITPELLVAAVKALASQAPALKDADAGLLPDVTKVREVSVHIAAAVISQAVKDGLAQEKNIPVTYDELGDWITEQMWNAQYRPLRKVGKSGASRLVKGELGREGAMNST